MRAASWTAAGTGQRRTAAPRSCSACRGTEGLAPQAHMAPSQQPQHPQGATTAMPATEPGPKRVPSALSGFMWDSFVHAGVLPEGQARCTVGREGPGGASSVTAVVSESENELWPLLHIWQLGHVGKEHWTKPWCQHAQPNALRDTGSLWSLPEVPGLSQGHGALGKPGKCRLMPCMVGTPPQLSACQRLPHLLVRADSRAGGAAV